jgi:uncharacterized membrane protein YebE (DUF533 family)
MDLNRIIGALGSSGVAGGLAGGVAGGALSSALMSKKGKKHAKNLLAAGGLAAIGSLAWKAYRNYQDNATSTEPAVQPAPAPATAASPPAPASWAALQEQDFALANTSTEGSRGLLLIRAMITAAMADGHMDNAERSAILGKMESLNLDADEKALVVDEILHPKSMEDILRAVVDQESAIEVYAASVLAIDESRPEAATYLNELAQRLSLPPLLTEALRSRVQQTLKADHQAA